MISSPTLLLFLSEITNSEIHAPRRMPPWRSLLFVAFFFFFFSILIHNGSVLAQEDYDDDGGGDENSVQLPKAAQSCNGIFLTYDFLSREREYPYVKNATAQSYAFKSTATVLNTMTEDLKAWSIFIGFQHREILVSASGAVITDATDFPAHVENGTSFSGSPQADLLNAVDTAGDLNQMMVKIDITGTQFGVKPPGIPMPKTIKLQNDGFKCPKVAQKGKHCIALHYFRSVISYWLALIGMRSMEERFEKGMIS